MNTGSDHTRIVATQRMQGDTLHIGGRLQREAVPALWTALLADANAHARLAQIDLAQVDALDTAGLALLVELAARTQRAGGSAPRILHAPAGYDALCAAYRIRPQLDELFP